MTDRDAPSPRILDGRVCAQATRAWTAQRVEQLGEKGVSPHLVVVRVGDDPASESYVRGKRRAAAACGLRADEFHLDAGVEQRDLEALIDRFNADDDVDGVLVQLPLPAGLEAGPLIERIDPARDVDGFHPANVGRMLIGASAGSDMQLLPCTPRGIMDLLAFYAVPLAGREAVVVGRSNIVGKPMAVLLTQANATVTLCHSRTRDLASHVARAEILVVAVGQAGLVAGEWVREGAVVVDAGINRLDDGTLVGDVAYAAAAQRASAITPVPGGVGPMTVATLLKQTVIAAAARRGIGLA